jgi:hypothetical protein
MLTFVCFKKDGLAYRYCSRVGDGFGAAGTASKFLPGAASTCCGSTTLALAISFVYIPFITYRYAQTSRVLVICWSQLK